MHHLSDAELVRRAHRGDVNSIGRLYDRHQLQIYRYVKSRIYDDQVANDLTGEVFLRMVSNLDTYRDTGAPFSAWLYRIAHNCIVSHIRKESRNEFGILPEEHPGDHRSHNPAVIVEERTTLREVQLALEKLDTLQREVVVLRFLVGLSLKEVAEATEKSVAAVKSIQHRGLKALRAIMS